MSGRGLVLFAAGMVTGAVALYAVLWSGGVLSPYLEGVRADAARSEVAGTARESGEADRMAPLPEPLNSEHRSVPPPPVAASENDGSRPILPLDNLKREDIRDTFDEGRSGGRAHEASDIMAPRGTPVRAMVDGKIQKLFNSKLGGLTVYQFDRDEKTCYYYAHLDRYADGIREGIEVARGTVIGFVGSTGNANPEAPHLHLAIFRLGPEKRWWEGIPINPYPILMEALR